MAHPLLRGLEQFRQDRSGVTAVEFSLVLPAALLLLFGIFETSRLIWTWSSLQYAVQDAARCMSVKTDTCSDAATTETYATTQYFAGAIPAGTFTALPAQPCGNMVTASYDYTLSIPLTVVPAVALSAQSCHP